MIQLSEHFAIADIRLATSTKPDGIARIYDARLIAPGPTANGWTFPAQALADSLSLWAGAGIYVDHPHLFDAPSVRNLIGVVTAPRYDADGIHAELHLFDHPQAQPVADLLDLILSLRAQGHPVPPTGLSAVLSVEWDTSGDSRTVTRIVKVWSVDVVFEPAAGGQLSRIVNSTSVHTHTHTDMTDTPITPEPASEPAGQPASQSTQISPATTALAQAVLQAQCEQLLDLRLDAAHLPDPVRAAIRARFTDESGHVRLFDPTELDAEIAHARSILGALAGDTVQGMGTPVYTRPTITGMWDQTDRIQAAYDILMGLNPDPNLRDVPRLTGIRELYHYVTGDRDLRGIFDPARAMFANATSSTLAELTRNVINKVVNQTWSNMTDYRWWERVVSIESFASLKDVSWVTVGGIGDLPTVTEGASYPEVNWDDNRETSSWLKKGGYLGLTLEMIDRDDTEKWRMVPRAMAIAALRTLSASVASIFTQSAGAGPTLSDGLPLFHGSHGNLRTAALSASEWDNVVQAVYKQSELNSGRRLGLRPSLLIVPIELRKTAVNIFVSAQEPGGNLNDVNVAGWTQNFSADNVIVCPEFTDTNDWAAMVDPRIAPAIGVGFRFGRTPEVFTAGDPTSYLMFHNDVMPIKVRYFYTVGVIDYRPIHKNNVA